VGSAWYLGIFLSSVSKECVSFLDFVMSLLSLTKVLYIVKMRRGRGTPHRLNILCVREMLDTVYQDFWRFLT
jgi:hypothetical protein